MEDILNIIEVITAGTTYLWYTSRIKVYMKFDFIKKFWLFED